MPWQDVVNNSRRRNTAPRSRYGTVDDVQRGQDDMIDAETALGTRATDGYLQRAENFDASKSLNQYAGGAWNSIQAALKDTLRDTRGAAVGAGRFDSGFLDEDQGTVINRATDQFSNDMAQQSVAAAQMQQRNTEGLAAFGSERSGRATDLLLSRSEQVQNDAREEAERRRRKRSGIAGAIGGVLGAGAGAFFGGPKGAQVGWGVGSSVGSGFGG